MKKPFINGYLIKKDELILPIERYEEAGYDVVEDDNYWIIGAINESNINKTSECMKNVFPWQYFYSFRRKELNDDSIR